MRRFVRRLQATRPWRSAGARLIGRAVVVRRAADAPRRALLDVYGDRPLSSASPPPSGSLDDADEGAPRRDIAWIALRSGRGVGGMLLAPFEGGLFLSAMRVRWPYRRCGVATALVRAAREEAGRRRATIWLVVAETNVPAIRLYRGAGFLVPPGPTPVDRPGHVTMRLDPGCGRDAVPRLSSREDAG